MSDTNETLAAALWRARLGGERIDPPQGLDEERAFAILAAVEETAPEPVGAWKVGATGPGGAAKLGLAGPFVGPIFAPYAKMAGANEYAATVPSANGLGAEIEFVFRFGREVPTGAPEADVAAAIDAVAPGLEITASRWTAPTNPPGPGTVADHAGNGLLLVGAFRTDWKGLDLTALEGTLAIDGESAGSARGTQVMGDPMNAVLLFAGALAARGRAIPAGTILTSGAIVGPVPISPGARVAGEISGFEPVSARVSVGQAAG